MRELSQLYSRPRAAHSLSRQNNGPLRPIQRVNYKVQLFLGDGKLWRRLRHIPFQFLLIYHGVLNIQRHVQPDRAFSARLCQINRFIHIKGNLIRAFYCYREFGNGFHNSFRICLLYADLPQRQSRGLNCLVISLLP